MIEVGDIVFHELILDLEGGRVVKLMSDRFCMVAWPDRVHPYVHLRQYVLKYPGPVAYTPTQLGDRDDDV